MPPLWLRVCFLVGAHVDVCSRVLELLKVVVTIVACFRIGYKDVPGTSYGIQYIIILYLEGSLGHYTRCFSRFRYGELPPVYLLALV